MPLLRFVILKQSTDQRVGVSFVAEDEDELEYGALVSRLQHNGIAEVAGLLKGDRVLSINNRQVASASSAAATIRSSLGDVDVVVERADPHEAQHRHLETEQGAGATEASAAEAMRTLRGWFAEATTPRGSRAEPGLLSLMGQSMLRLMAPNEHHEAATLVGAHWRGFRTRALCYVWHWAATELQRSARGRQVRSLVLPALREERAIATTRRAKALHVQAEEVRQRCEYLRECRATEKFLQAEAAVPAPVSRIKKALSFGSKKKRNPNRVPLAENGEVHNLNLASILAGTAVSSRSDSSGGGARTPPPASPRGGGGVSPAQPWCTPPKPPHTAPVKRSVRRSLSWTRRTTKHIEADANAKQREIAL